MRHSRESLYFFGRRRELDDQGPQPEAPLPSVSPDHAWKALGLVNDWIRHSDAKAGVTLAFTGALGAILFNMVKESAPTGPLFNYAVIAACALLLSGAALCGWTLAPRLRDNEADPQARNLLFFASITRHFAGNRTRYAEALRVLTSDPDGLVLDLAHQIHANAKIATIKARTVTCAIRVVLLASACVAAVALMIGINIA